MLLDRSKLLMNKFDLDISNLNIKKVVNIAVNDTFLEYFIKQKLTYAGIPCYCKNVGENVYEKPPLSKPIHALVHKMITIFSAKLAEFYKHYF
jgi:hypothetical protein